MFETRLLTDNELDSIEAGFGASSIIDPDQWAEQMGIEPISGAWLCAYCIRRFGWPNIGSDDHKQLCTWVLTTPVNGFFLGVTPYLVEPSFMHFSVYFTEAVRPKIYEDPQADAVRAEAEQIAKEWWESTGKDRYVLGTTNIPRPLALYVSESEEGVCGFYERTPEEPPQDFPTENVNWAAWLIRELIRERHPDEVTFPKHELGPRQPTPFQIECKKAVQTVVKDLLRPTYVRDVYFTPHGNTDPDESGTAEPFEHAGIAPKYLYQKDHESNTRNS